MAKVYFDFQDMGNGNVILKLCEANYWDANKRLPEQDEILVLQNLTMSHVMPVYKVVFELDVEEVDTLTYKLTPETVEKLRDIFNVDYVLEYEEHKLVA